VLGTGGKVSPDGVLTVSIPRNITVTLDGVHLAQGSDLAHELDFMRIGNSTLVVGELVLKEDEVNVVTRELLQAGLEETALHNHLNRLSPRLLYMHIHGLGDAVQMDTAISNIIYSVPGGTALADEGKVGLDTSSLDAAMGYKGETGEGVHSYGIPRADTITMNGIALLPEMDISTGIVFQPAGEGKAALIGEFVLEPGEVGPVIKSLSDNGIEVTALHSHMLTEQPRLFYVHCWGTGNPAQLAHGIREAIDLTNSVRSSSINLP